MSIEDPKVSEMRVKWLALEERKRFAANQARKVFFHFMPLRFIDFELKIEQFERSRVRFAVHTARAEYALLPELAQFVLAEVA